MWESLTLIHCSYFVEEVKLCQHQQCLIAVTTLPIYSNCSIVLLYHCTSLYSYSLVTDTAAQQVGVGQTSFIPPPDLRINCTDLVQTWSSSSAAIIPPGNLEFIVYCLNEPCESLETGD